jgi:hypothetical protein
MIISKNMKRLLSGFGTIILLFSIVNFLLLRMFQNFDKILLISSSLSMILIIFFIGPPVDNFMNSNNDDDE